MESDIAPRRSILVVDDDPVFCSIMQEVLGRSGYSVRWVHSAKEALAALAHFAPDLVLTDVMMPDTDGLTLVRQIRQDPRWREIPTVVISARVMGSERDAAKQAGADAFLGKPFSIRSLTRTIDEILPAN